MKWQLFNLDTERMNATFYFSCRNRLIPLAFYIGNYRRTCFKIVFVFKKGKV